MTLTDLFDISDFTDEKGMLFNRDCMELLPFIEEEAINLTLTDIPYDMIASIVHQMDLETLIKVAQIF